ncbi:TonB-dependent receptor [Marinibactrum halimedae]|uniref:TonB-dependent receptor n=1 Tax=Marinibactrum halimedae TaxID=1444977 RepID=A0AA37T0X2_9GAMM|nr:TonB-dependent receptor [Marinibactrum halimedae]MCD9457711.1 TonB-dependent receptor [Marinibactrum halimedae]GLS24915.1 TonB-dependent receptor [Marinibactrum halimedae]
MSNQLSVSLFLASMSFIFPLGVQASDSEQATVEINEEGIRQNNIHLAHSGISELETVIVTATREEKRKMDIPESVQAFNESDIQAVSPSHPSEILNRAAGVHVNNLGGEGHMTAIRQPITTRGVYLYLEDGVPVRPTGFFNHNALYEVNIPQSGQLEVTKGPGSALYGSDAIGGIINSVSKKPPQQTETKVNLEAGSYGWQRGLLSVGTTQDIGALTHGIHVNFNTTDNDGFRDHAEYTRESLTGRWDVSGNEGFRVKSLFSYTEVDQSGISSLEEEDYRENTERNGFQGDSAFREVKALRLSSEFSWKNSENTLFTLTPYYRNNELSMSPSWMVNYDPNERKNTFQSYGMLGKYRIDSHEHLQWIMGVDVDYTPSEYEEFAVSYETDGTVFSGFSRLDHKNYDYTAKQTSLSPYLQIEAELTEQLILQAGIRYDHFRIEYQNNVDETVPNRIFIPQLGRPVTHFRPQDETASFDAISPKLGLVYQWLNEHSVYANYREAFSIPSVGTLFRSGTTNNSNELEPISAKSYEVGMRGALTQKWFYELALYRMDISDDLISVVNGFERNRFNAGETRHEGIEVLLKGNITESLALAVAFTKTRQIYRDFSYVCCFPPQNITVSGNDVGKAPETIGNVSLAYHPKALPGVRVELEWEHLGEYYTDETNTQKYGGHGLYNVRAKYALNDRFEIYGRVQNLTDKLYSTYTSNQVGDPDISYRPGMPRAVFGGFRYTF